MNSSADLYAGGLKLVDRERALGSDLPSLVYVLDVTDTGGS